MGTKNNPGEFDCYAAAEPDEPLFTLLGRDPLASHLVRLWAALRIGNQANARHIIDGLLRAAMTQGPIDQHDIAKALEATNCATAMLTFHFQRRNAQRPPEERGV
jgi:hypothetical protein